MTETAKSTPTFAKKFYNAVGAGDAYTRDQMVATELARLIDEKPMTVIQLIDNAGWKFNQEPKTKADLIEAVAEMMVKSPVFNQQIGVLIALNNRILSYNDIVLLATGPKKINPKYYNFIGAIVGAVGGIAQGAMNIGAAKIDQKTSAEKSKADLLLADKQKDIAKESTKQALLNTISNKLAGAQQRVQGPSQSVIIALILVFVVGSIGLFYVLTRPKAAALAPMAPMPPKMENGGPTITHIPDIEGLPSSSPTPAPPAPTTSTPIDTVIQTSV